MALLKTIALYRRDFKDSADGFSFFDTVLSHFDIPESGYGEIDSIEFNYEPDSLVLFDKYFCKISLSEEP